MGRKIPFTEKQIRILESNKYTHSVTPQRIVFTLEFKQFFLQQVMEHNKTTPQILEAAGYDPAFFNKSNRDFIRKTILSEAKSETGLKAPKGKSTEDKLNAFAAKDLSKQQTNTSIKELQDRIVYLEKQIEFLKKISQIE